MQRVAELVGLTDFLARKPAQLSGGQRQRVALARAIIAENPICLMDEPLSNLDAKLRQDMRTEIRALQQRLGMTMIYVTHDQSEAMSMADRIVLMRDGQVEQEGPPEVLYEQPGTAFAARFIGSPAMNLIDLSAADRGPALQAVRDQLGREFELGNRDIWLGLRPEDVAIVPDAGVPVEWAASDYLGADTIVMAQIEGQTISIRQPGRFSPPPRPNQRLYLRWAPGTVHLFDRVTGRRLASVGSNVSTGQKQP